MVIRLHAAAALVLVGLFAGWHAAAAQARKNVTTTGGLVTQVHFIPDPPKSGSPLLTWFMLTKRTQANNRHENIALAQCRCVMAVYGASGPSSAPILKPTLQSVKANGRSNLIGAKVSFPSPGHYIVQLAGRSTKAGDFTAFRTDFVVDVAAP